MVERETAKSGMRVLHARYGQGRIRTIIGRQLEIDFDDGKRRYLKNSGYIKLNPGKNEGADPNLLDFPESFISKKEITMVQESKERKKIKEGIEEKGKDKKKNVEKSKLQIAKAAIRDELKKKGNKELRSLCATFPEIKYNSYSHLPDSLKRMNVLNKLSHQMALKTV